MFVKILPNVRQRRQKNLENSWTQAVEVTLILLTISISCGNLNVKGEKNSRAHINDCLWDMSCKNTSPMFSVSKGFRSFEMVLMDSTRSTLQTPVLTACYKKGSFLHEVNGIQNQGFDPSLNFGLRKHSL